MSIYTISICTLMYALTSFSCIKDKDYSHALMWFAYGLANVGLLWYEVNKHKSG
jgi:hypothetical protein